MFRRLERLGEVFENRLNKDLPAEVLFGVAAPPEYLIVWILWKYIAAITNIDSVSLSDAWGVGKSRVKMYERRYDDLFTSVRAYSSAKTLRKSPRGW